MLESFYVAFYHRDLKPENILLDDNGKSNFSSNELNMQLHCTDHTFSFPLCSVNYI